MDELTALLGRAKQPIVLLRPLTSQFDPTTDDIDLLLSAECRQQLLVKALDAATEGRFSFRVTQSDSAKTRLTLYAANTGEHLDVDLWSEFTQLPRHQFRRRTVSAIAILTAMQSDDSELSGAVRCDAELEFCLLVLHLAAKHKPIQKSVTSQRIREAADRLTVAISECSVEDKARLSALLNQSQQLMEADTVSREAVRLTESALLHRVGIAAKRRRSVTTTVRACWMRMTKSLAVVGSDGSGKSTLVSALSKHQAKHFRPLTAKKLYRRSWLYQCVGGIAKRMTGMSRCALDDRLAPVLTLRAGCNLWLRQFVQSVANVGRAMMNHPIRRLVLDRSVASCLIIQRTTLRPRRTAAWLERLLPPVTTVLLSLPHDRLMQRKHEQPHAEGHAEYQRLLMQQALAQCPSDLILVAPTDTVDATVASLNRVLDRVPRRVSRPARSRLASAIRQPLHGRPRLNQTHAGTGG